MDGTNGKKVAGVANQVRYVSEKRALTPQQKQQQVKQGTKNERTNEKPSTNPKNLEKRASRPLIPKLDLSKLKQDNQSGKNSSPATQTKASFSTNPFDENFVDPDEGKKAKVLTNKNQPESKNVQTQSSGNPFEDIPDHDPDDYEGNPFSEKAQQINQKPSATTASAQKKSLAAKKPESELKAIEDKKSQSSTAKTSKQGNAAKVYKELQAQVTKGNTSISKMEIKDQDLIANLMSTMELLDMQRDKKVDSKIVDTLQAAIKVALRFIPLLQNIDKYPENMQEVLQELPKLENALAALKNIDDEKLGEIGQPLKTAFVNGLTNLKKSVVDVQKQAYEKLNSEWNGAIFQKGLKAKVSDATNKTMIKNSLSLLKNLNDASSAKKTDQSYLDSVHGIQKQIRTLRNLADPKSKTTDEVRKFATQLITQLNAFWVKTYPDPVQQVKAQLNVDMQKMPSIDQNLTANFLRNDETHTQNVIREQVAPIFSGFATQEKLWEIDGLSIQIGIKLTGDQQKNIDNAAQKIMNTITTEIQNPNSSLGLMAQFFYVAMQEIENRSTTASDEVKKHNQSAVLSKFMLACTASTIPPTPVAGLIDQSLKNLLKLDNQDLPQAKLAQEFYDTLYNTGRTIEDNQQKSATA